MTWQTYFKHYSAGLLASCWNAGIAALYATLGQSAGARVMKDIPAPGFHEVAAIFVGATLLEALQFFMQNPLPVPEIHPTPPVP